MCVCAYLWFFVIDSEYDKQSLLARCGGDILRPRDVHKVRETVLHKWVVGSVEFLPNSTYRKVIQFVFYSHFFGQYWWCFSYMFSYHYSYY